MDIKELTPEQLVKYRPHIIRFFQKHGDKRITKNGLRWFQSISAEELSAEGTLILIALKNKQITGALAISDYGRKESFVAVHQEFRQNRIGENLVEYMIQRLGKAYGRVALDNIPSLKMCLAMGMVGFKLINGPTGKPTMWMGAGNWNKEDVE